MYAGCAASAWSTRRRSRARPGSFWGSAPTGREFAEELRRRADDEHPQALAELAAIRREISGLSFSELLQHVYDRYPDEALGALAA